jgi:hypothetical protein
MGRRRRRDAALPRLVILFALGALVAACSPEATRTRNGGPGADVGNRHGATELRGSIDPFHGVPRVGEAARR